MGSGIRLYTTCRQCVEKIRAYWWTARIRSHGCTRPIHCRRTIHYLCDTIESRGLIRILYFYIYIRCTHTATYSTRIAIHSQKWILKTAAAAAKKNNRKLLLSRPQRVLWMPRWCRMSKLITTFLWTQIAENFSVFAENSFSLCVSTANPINLK